MPANLPPEYFEAEKRFKQAATSQEKVAALEELISTVPKHKGTENYFTYSGNIVITKIIEAFTKV